MKTFHLAQKCKSSKITTNTSFVQHSKQQRQ